MAKKPISDRKLQANRANAKKSTGPRTEEGKARSRQNALQHGLLARYVIPENDPVEKAIDYEALLYELQVQFNPRDLFEHMCIRRLANCHWRLDRAMRYEIQAIENARTNDHTPMSVLSRSLLGTDEPDPGRHVLPPGQVLDRLIRYETMINHELQRVLNQLRDHRKQPAEALELSYKRAAQTKYRVDQGDVCPFCGETMKLPLVPPDPPPSAESVPAPNEATAPVPDEPTTAPAPAPAPNEATGAAGVSPASDEPADAPAPNEPNPAPEPISPSPSLKSQISDLKSPPSVSPSLNLSVPPSPAQNEPKNPIGARASAVPDAVPNSINPISAPSASSAPSILCEVSASPRLCGSIPSAQNEPKSPSSSANSQFSTLNSQFSPDPISALSASSAPSILCEVSASPRLCGSMPSAPNEAKSPSSSANSQFSTLNSQFSPDPISAPSASSAPSILCEVSASPRLCGSIPHSPRIRAPLCAFPPHSLAASFSRPYSAAGGRPRSLRGGFRQVKAGFP